MRATRQLWEADESCVYRLGEVVDAFDLGLGLISPHMNLNLTACVSAFHLQGLSKHTYGTMKSLLEQINS